MKTMRRKTDVAIAGSGPGGATLARALARAGKKVLVLEKGRDVRRVGPHLSALFYTEHAGLRFTDEGMNIIRALATGGSTLSYCGSAARPPRWLKTRHGIDLSSYVDETVRELDLKPLPDDVVGSAGLRIMEAANDLGYRFEKMDKFIDPEKCISRCGGTCMLGCPHGAKWTAREYIRDMVEAGGEIVNRADVQAVTVEDGTAVGLRAKVPGGVLEVEAKVVVLAAGGLGTPIILKRSGIDEAGRGMFVDPLVFVTGVSKGRGTCQGPPMSVATYEFMEEGFLLSDLIDPWGLWIVMALRKNPSRVLDFFRYRRQLGLMVKIGDEHRGEIRMDGGISKPLTDRDHKRLKRGAEISKKILFRAGCSSRSIIVGPVRGAHPGATAPIGKVVDENLETRIRNLFVSDASVLPEALDRPLVLTLISLSKRLADHLRNENRV